MKKDPVFVVLAVRVMRDVENSTGPIFMQQIFSTIHGLPKKTRVSFEIFYADGVVHFLVAVPHRYRALIEEQVYAQYPSAQITVVEDPLSFPLDGFCVSAELHFLSPDLYPVKRYQQFEDRLARVAVDPLAGITESLGNALCLSESACFQIIIQPLEDRWRLVYRHCLQILHRSTGFFFRIPLFYHFYARIYCTRSFLMRFLLWPLYGWFWFVGVIASSSSSLTPDFKKEHAVEEVTTVHERETALSAAADKIAKLAFVATMRILVACSHDHASHRIRTIAAAFQQFTVPHINGFRLGRFRHDATRSFLQRRLGHTVVLNTEELATLYHFPTAMVHTPGIAWVASRSLPPPVLPSSFDVVVGTTDFRDRRLSFGLLREDRRRHMYIIGKTGMGKSTMLENMIFSDIQDGHGVAVIDPHGDLAEKVLHFVPSHRTNDVILFDPSDRAFPVAFNVMATKDAASHTMIASGIVGIFKKIYGESWGPRLEYILRNTVLALLSYQNMTLLGIMRMLQDAGFRRRIVAAISDPLLRHFWVDEFERMDARQRTEAIAPILNKVGQFLSSPIMRNILGQPKSTVHLGFAMDRRKIVIVNLAKGKIGEDQSSLLGALLITQFQLEAMARASLSVAERCDFFLYVDEFQNFATDSFATILSEARKYHLSLILAHQYTTQMTDVVRDAVFGNVGTILSFQIGSDDAEQLALQFAEDVTPRDLLSLEKYHFYVRLLLHGVPTKVFSATTLPPVSCMQDAVRIEKILQFVRERYARPVSIVEEKIHRWAG